MTVNSAPSRRGRLPREEADQRVGRLMDIALREFANFGFGGTSLNRLVALSGVSKTTIVRRFGSKEGLFLRLLDQSVMDVRDALRSCPAASTDPLAAIEQFVETLSRFATEEVSQALLRLAVSEKMRFPHLAETEMVYAHETFRPISDYLAELMQQERMESDDPVEAAFELVAMANHGFRMMIDDTAYLVSKGRSRAIALRFLAGRGFQAGL